MSKVPTLKQYKDLEKLLNAQTLTVLTMEENLAFFKVKIEELEKLLIRKVDPSWVMEVQNYLSGRCNKIEEKLESLTDCKQPDKETSKPEPPTPEISKPVLKRYKDYHGVPFWGYKNQYGNVMNIASGVLYTGVKEISE